jgi:hypothetical protein
MGLSKNQKNALKSPEKLDSQGRANANYRNRRKLENELDGLDDLEIMLSHLPRDHAKKAVKDKHVAKAMKILLELLDLREFKRVRQNSPGKEGYVIKPHRGVYQRVQPHKNDYKRYRAMSDFVIHFKEYFNLRVVLPGERDFMDCAPTPRASGDWLSIDDDIDYMIHLQQLYGDSDKLTYKISALDKRRIKEIEKKLFDPAIDPETRMKLVLESIHLKTTGRAIDMHCVI